MTQGSLRLRVQGKGRAGLRIGFSRGLGRLGSAAWTNKGLQCRYRGLDSPRCGVLLRVCAWVKGFSYRARVFSMEAYLIITLNTILLLTLPCLGTESHETIT